ncbi:2-C-methyl-D-erythritol 4-phosphate cytidylyltransferase [Enterocloster aldenensis]|uniref:IspD/TarI family cytidylyltransferase n=1 Tax=Enterocloster aldenensis TaxID=358742 RepID=UPI000E474994|nr:2-C-methyl-D-erythritol 4-phosphate cytidylyltransferase [Enterocloster aldenensis]
MNVAVIFAGGVGVRMHTKNKPKQFLNVHGKPIIVHTIEVFENHPKIDGIIVVCVSEWLQYMEKLAMYYHLNKIKKIVPGGRTGQLSIYNGLEAAENEFGLNDTIVLIHDGVRPLITADEITANIDCVKKNGSAITCAATKETFVIVNEDNQVIDVPNRQYSFIAKAPQSFYLSDILKIDRQAISEGQTEIIDSCTLMMMYGKKISVVKGSYENIKITTSDDFFMFRALSDAHENNQLEFI